MWSKFILPSGEFGKVRGLNQGGGGPGLATVASHLGD